MPAGGYSARSAGGRASPGKYPLSPLPGPPTRVYPKCSIPRPAGRPRSNTSSGASLTSGTPGIKPRTNPPRTRKIGYGTSRTSESNTRPATATSNPKTMTRSAPPLLTPYAQHGLAGVTALQQPLSHLADLLPRSLDAHVWPELPLGDQGCEPRKPVGRRMRQHLVKEDEPVQPRPAHEVEAPHIEARLRRPRSPERDAGSTGCEHSNSIAQDLTTDRFED